MIEETLGIEETKWKKRKEILNDDGRIQDQRDTQKERFSTSGTLFTMRMMTREFFD